LVHAPQRVDPQDTNTFDEWYDVFAAAFDREFATTMTRDEILVALTHPSPFWDTQLWFVRDDDGTVAGVLSLDLALQDNTSVLTARIGVRPDRRRRGFGSALMAHVEELAGLHDRTVLQGEVDAPVSGESPGSEFARAHGFELANTEAHRVLELPLAAELLDRLAAEAADRHAGYAMVTWQDRCPDELVDGYAGLIAAFSAAVPLGDLQWEAEVWDAERVRVREGRAVEQGRPTWTTVAVAPDGALAGHSGLVLPDEPGKVYQQDTLVLPDHRGRRLGLAMKVRNHAELQAAYQGPAVAHTWNAEQNAHMNAVNALLGYRRVELSQEWQRALRRAE
jgi:GNAT superfamily N-acetyltransferase